VRCVARVTAYHQDHGRAPLLLQRAGHGSADRSCFLEDAVGTLLSGAAAQVAALRVEDVVVTGPVTAYLVLGLSQAEEAGAARYVTLTAGAAGTLTATPGHYVRVSPDRRGATATPPSGAYLATASRLIAAETMRVGDLVLPHPPPPPPLVGARSTGGTPPSGGGVSTTARRAGATAGAAVPAAMWAPVSAIAVDSAPMARGLYNSLPLDGGVVVDGFAASIRTATVAPGVVAVAPAPARAALSGGLGRGRWRPLAAGRGGGGRAGGLGGSAFVLVR